MKVSASGQPDRGGSRLPLAIAAAYLIAHLPFLAPSLEDIDSINFALGLRNFDPALHQPHPPGYPIYIALGHVSLAIVHVLFPSMPQVSAEALALSIWSAVGGAVAILAAARWYRALARRQEEHGGVDVWATALLAATPLFWMCGLRPMSDMPGLAAALGAQALLLEGTGDRRRLTQGAFLAGLAAGIRIQTLTLTVPVLLFGLGAQRGAGIRWLITRPVAAIVAGGLAWGVPLIVATGGVDAYLRALGSQAGEDFGWVDMLLMNPTPRRAAFAFYQTFVLPWASIPLAAAVAAASVAGALFLLARQRRALLVSLCAFAPYVIYHLLLQETVTVRYALPVMPFIAWLAAQGLASARRFTPLVAMPLVAAALLVALAGASAYGGEVHPAFRAIADAVRRAEAQAPAALYSHFELRRPLQAADTRGLHVVEPRWQHELTGPVNYWRGGGMQPVWFLAESRRTDLALVDPQSRRDVVRYRWRAKDRPELSGTRPLDVDWYRISPPGWFAGEGWSLTPETGGLARATRSGPDRRPIEAWVRRRPGPMHMMVGVYHLGNAGDPDAQFDVMMDGTLVDRWALTFAERSALRFIDLPRGLPQSADAFAHLTISTRNPADSGRSVEAAVRQFDIQPASQLIYGFGEGWHEEEFTLATGTRWRWTSERSVVRIDGPSTDVRITIRGESPLKYFDRPPTVRIVAGGRTVAEFHPDADFEWSVVVPADDVVKSGGALTLETDRIYLPAQVEGKGDTRHLGLRVFETRVESVANNVPKKH